ncbi:MAG: Gfo/Idh/MocA family oxidoreductase [Myxococcota bacterium]
MTRIAVVGAGGWGKNHVRNFASLGTLRVVCDKAADVRTRHEGAHPGVRVVEQIADALDDFDAAVVATHAPSHAEVALSLLEAGKDVLVEKPLALSSEDAERLCTVAEREGRILMVGHLLLFHPVVQTLKALIDAGELGDILYVVARRLNLGVVRRDENAWWSLAPHDLSIAGYLLGTEPRSVSATGGVFLQTDANVEDVVFATVRYSEGRLAHVHVSWLDPHKTRMLTVVGSKKMAVFDDTSPDQKLQVFDKGVEPPQALSYADGVRLRTGDIRIPAIRMAEPLRRECEAFLRAVETREVPMADGRSGLAVVRALEAGARSLRERGREVAIE